MKLSTANTILLIAVILFSLGYLSPSRNGMNVNFNVKLVSYFNFLLFISSLICIKQFFWPGDENRLPFQIFNMVFVILFYTLSFSFLFAHKVYYDYVQLTDMQVFKKFVTSWDMFCFMFWIIAGTFLINVLYIFKYRSSYFKYQ